MTAYRQGWNKKSPAHWLPVHRDQLWAQRLVTCMGELYLVTCKNDLPISDQAHDKRQCMTGLKDRHWTASPCLTQQRHITVMSLSNLHAQNTLSFMLTAYADKLRFTVTPHNVGTSRCLLVMNFWQKLKTSSSAMAERPREAWYFSINVQRY